MRRKYLFSLLLALVTLLGAAKFAHHATLRSGLDDLSRSSQERLKLIAATLSTRIERFRYLPEVVARSHETQDLFLAPGDAGRTREANLLLERIADASGALALFVTDRSGLTIAASNHGKPGSFIGENYSYRPYFRNALSNGFGRYYAVGATTAQPGYFLSVPVNVDGAAAGVAIVKIDLLPVEDQWRDAAEQVAMSDRQGVVFLSSRANWHYLATRPLDSDTHARLREERRYGEAEILPLKFASETVSGHDIVDLHDGRGAMWLRSVASFGEDGWEMSYFASLEEVRHQAATAAGAVVMGMLLVGSVAVIAFQIHRSRMIARQEFERLETRVAERTLALFGTNARLQQEIAERQEAERQLNVTRSNLSQAEKLALVGQALAGFSHEINQPLAALATYAASTKLLLQRGQYDAVGANMNTMGEVIARVSDLTTQLKRLARRNEDKLVELDLGAVAERILNLLKYRFADLGIGLTHEIEPKLQVCGSASQLDQVFLNLLNNAIDAVRDQAEPRIEVHAFVSQGFCKVAIHDNGAGLTPEINAHIFEPFHTTKAPGVGLGLGLATAHRIVSNHHGILSADPSPLGGAVFTVSLRQVTARQTGPMETVI